MEQRSNDALVRGVQMEPSKEECVRGMGLNSNDAALKDAQRMSYKEECALSTGQE
jgi:hypothetical protein